MSAVQLVKLDGWVEQMLTSKCVIKRPLRVWEISPRYAPLVMYRITLRYNRHKCDKCYNWYKWYKHHWKYTS